MGCSGCCKNFANLVLHAGQHFVHVNDAGPKSVPIRSRIRAAGPVPMSVFTRIANSSLQKLFIDQPPFALEQIANVGVEDVVRLLQRRAEACRTGPASARFRRFRFGCALLPALPRPAAGFFRGFFFLNRSKTPMQIQVLEI